MSQQHDRTRVTETLRAASGEYDDLPADVQARLDRVLHQLPAADTLHHGERDGLLATWAERLRPKRVRYALISATAAILLTVGGVGVALQVVNDAPSSDAGATADLSDDTLADESERSEPGAEAEDEVEESAEVETFATGTDYTGDGDLLDALRGLGSQSTTSTTGAVPEELAPLAEGGDFWQACQDALAGRYDGLLVAVDFARFESEPAVVALLVADSGEIAVAVGPACADGTIDELDREA
ncbi:hypothetical protein [Glycomyces buryatensis]|uniref:Uncharacterized protein n=1 Tax=Glycomyces buryatensis TaxID=2570927 RepID=A0A4V4HSF1_9ACTN|nr:hypothetical protein [Glycomyces buryatensis]THV40616.1 hypothetical protein FAB82_15250 [Glycomyces buryatensis]